MGKRDAWLGMADFRQQIERMLDEGRAPQCGPCPAGYVWTPLADIQETLQAVIIQLELPGVPVQSVLVEIVDGDLVVRGERPCSRAPGQIDPDPVYHLMERAHGPFARRFALPPGVDGQAVTASLSDGLMTIVVPKGAPKRPSCFSVSIG
ncbi:Hsp20/alpha crystallin family protein [Humidesulfovibrio sp.]